MWGNPELCPFPDSISLHVVHKSAETNMHVIVNMARCRDQETGIYCTKYRGPSDTETRGIQDTGTGP